MKTRKYMGCVIERAGLNSSGIRWVAFTDKGNLRSDTLAGVKKLIKGGQA